MKKATQHELLPIRLIEDQPMDDLGKDYLGLMPWARMIAGTAVGTPGPFTIGVHGEWGYGKTTLLKLAKCLIDENHNDVVTVWFNAWQFEREEHPLFPLIAAIADEIEKKTDKTALDKGKERLKKIGLSLRALCRGMKFKGEVGMPLVGSVGAEFDAGKALDAEDLLGKQTNPLLAEMMYHSAFGVLEEATRSEDKEDGVKIVVFVDDLDRCQPDKAVFLLESIKLILAQPGFIFVLAVDRGVIEDYLKKRYCELCGDGIGDRGRFYMEKIIQLPIVIPSHKSRFAEFVRRIVADLSKHHGDEITALKNIQEVLATGAGTNPRSLIRLVNNFLLDCKLWPLIEHDEQYQDLGEEIVSALAFNRILQHDLGSLYTVLIGDQNLCDAIYSEGEEGVRRYADERSKDDRGEEGSAVHPRLREEEDRLSSVARELLRRPELLEALRKHGEKWLRRENLRRVVHEFAQTERAVGTVEFPELIAEKVREALGLQADEPIPFGRLSEVKVLNLSHTSVTDGGLAHIKGLPGLQDLGLAATKVTDAGLAHLERSSGLQVLSLALTGVTDAGLVHLTGLSALQALSLRDTSVADAGLAHLKGLPELGSLYLHRTHVTDAGLAHLEGLTGLRELYLQETQVTDAGLAHLKGLSGLRHLYLDETRVTDAGVAALKKALPNLEVHM